MPKKICILDLDDTLIDGQSQLFLIIFLKKKGLINLISYVRIIIWFLAYKIGLNLDPKKIIEYSLAFLKQISIKEGNKVLEEFYNEVLRYKIREEILQLVNKYDEVIIVSNVVKPLVDVISAKLKFKKSFCTKLEIVNDAYTGKIDGEIVYGITKLNYLRNVRKESPNSFLVGFADHYSDIPMLKYCDEQYIVNPNRKMRSIVKTMNWKIVQVSNA